MIGTFTLKGLPLKFVIRPGGVINIGTFKTKLVPSTLAQFPGNSLVETLWNLTSRPFYFELLPKHQGFPANTHSITGWFLLTWLNWTIKKSTTVSLHCLIEVFSRSRTAFFLSGGRVWLSAWGHVFTPYPTKRKAVRDLEKSFNEAMQTVLHTV